MISIGLWGTYYTYNKESQNSIGKYLGRYITGDCLVLGQDASFTVLI